jgi:MOSC domain-containing protein YiiM
MRELIATVEAVCLSVPGVRVAKAPREEAFIGPHGFVGDRHEAEYRKAPGGEGLRANERQWSAVCTKEVEELCADMGLEIAFEPGAMGENLRLSGLRLADVPAGSVLEFPSGARLQVSKRNDPCVNAARELSQAYGSVVGEQFVKQAFGRRGILGTVIETGIIRAGDAVRVLVLDAAPTR